MDKAKKDLSIIEHILAYCTEIEQTVTRFGDTFESFEMDKIYRNAATMCILQIGELAGTSLRRIWKRRVCLPESSQGMTPFSSIHFAFLLLICATARNCSNESVSEQFFNNAI